MYMMLKMPVACLLLLSYAFYYYKKNKRLRTHTTAMFEAMMYTVLVNLVADAVTEFTVNHRDLVPELFNYVWHIVFLLTILNLCFFMYFYLITYVERGAGVSKQREKKWTVLVWIAVAIAILLLPIEYIDTQYGSYSLGPKAYALYCGVIYVMLVMLHNLFCYQKQIPKEKKDVVLASIGIFVVFAVAQIVLPYILVTGLGMSMIVMGIMMSTEDSHMYLDMRTGYYNELGGKELISDLFGRNKSFQAAAYVYIGDSAQILNAMKEASRHMQEKYGAEAIILFDNVLLFIQSAYVKKRIPFPEELPRFTDENSCISESCMVLICTPGQTSEEILKEVYSYKEKIEEAELYRDELTGLLRRGPFIRKVNEYLRRKKTFALFMIDVDDFKNVNDTYGHMVGDDVLCKMADVFVNTTRDKDIICRMGGDEFAVLLAGVTEVNQVKEIISRMEDQISKMSTQKSMLENIHVSFGVKMCTDFSENIAFQQIYEQADMALYQAKQKGKNCWVIFE